MKKILVYYPQDNKPLVYSIRETDAALDLKMRIASDLDVRINSQTLLYKDFNGMLVFYSFL